MSAATRHCTAALLDALRAHGIAPVDDAALVPDGILRRFRVEGDKAGSRNGWAVLHPDHGVAGSWKTGITCTWSAKSARSMTRQEKDEHFRLIRQAKAEAQRQREAEQQAAAARASLLWAKATPARADHPYLVRKRIPPGNARQSGDLLVLRIEDVNGTTRSLQFISPDGTKKLLSDGAKRSHFIVVAGSLPAKVVVIAEGFATASTVAMRNFPGDCALAAIDAGNLEPVALAIRAKYPAAEIVIAADDDRLTPGNPGLTKARAAAAVRCKLIRPAWPEGAPESLSDFNDLAVFMEVPA